MKDLIVFLIMLFIYFLLALFAQKLNNIYSFKKHIFVWVCLILLISCFIKYINDFLIYFI